MSIRYDRLFLRKQLRRSIQELQAAGLQSQTAAIHCCIRRVSVNIRKQCDHSCKIFICQYTLYRCHISRIGGISVEQFLKRHTSDPCNRVKGCQCKCRYTHGHKYSCNGNRDTKFSRNPATPEEKMENGVPSGFVPFTATAPTTTKETIPSKDSTTMAP